MTRTNWSSAGLGEARLKIRRGVGPAAGQVGMMLNLNSDEWISLDPTKWTALQAEVCMNVANAKFNAFVVEAYRLAEFVRLGLLSRATAADYLYEAAVYNQLNFEYGTDAIQAIIADAFKCEAA